MARLKPYTLDQANELFKDAKSRSDNRHGMWRALEHLYRTGEVNESMDAGDVPPRLWDDLPGLTLDGVNMILPHMQILIQTVIQHDPGFLAEPFTGGERAEQGAQLAEELLKYWWKRLDGTDVARQMAQDFVLLGSGFARVGWTYEQEDVDRDDDELRDELAKMIDAERRDALLSRPQRRERDPEELFDLIDTVRTEKTTDEPFIEYVSPYDVFVPANARRIEEARWVAHRMVLPYDEVVNNPAFSNTDHLQPATRADYARWRGDDERQRGGSETGNHEDDPFAEVTLVEFYDMRTRTMLVFQEDAEKTLYEDDLPYSHRYPPIVHMRNFEDGSRFWPFGDLENVASIQEQFNEFVYEQIGNARRAGNKYAVDKDALDEDVRELLTAEESDVVVPVTLGSQSISDIVQVLPRQATDPEVFQGKEEMLRAMTDVLGLNDFQTGGSGADRMSATAAAVVDGTATLRATDKKFQVEEALARIGQRVLLLCQEFLDEAQALRIVGPTGEVGWLDASREDLIGEFGVNVEAGSTQAVNPATQQEKAIEIMTSIIPALAAEGYDTQPLWRQALRDYGLDPDRFLKRAPMPQGPAQGQPGQGAGTGGGPPQGGGTPDAVQAGGTPNETVPQERAGGPPVPAATNGGVNL